MVRPWRPDTDLRLTVSVFVGHIIHVEQTFSSAVQILMETPNRLDLDKLHLFVSLKYSWELIDEWRTSNTARVSYLSKPVLLDVVPLVQELWTCTVLLDSTSLGFRMTKV